VTRLRAAIVLLLPAGALAAPAVSITVEREPGPAARVTIACPGAPSGTTVFEVDPPAGGAPDEQVQEVTARDAAGAALPVEHPPGARWTVHHLPGAPLEVTYTLVPRRSPPPPGNPFWPILQPGFVHLLGDTAFLHAPHLDEEPGLPVTLQWKGYARAACSFGEGLGPIRSGVPLGPFRHATFLAGELDVAHRAIHGQPVTVAAAGAYWTGGAAEVADLAVPILEAERDFFADHTQPRFLITLIPNGLPDERSLSLGGTGLTDSFATFLQPLLDLRPAGPHRRALVTLIAHEYLHRWNGEVIARAAPEELVYWFTEGFTDFFARRILLRHGMLTPAQWLEVTNEACCRYQQSPVQNAPAERIRADFWKDPDVQQLPYLRGAVVAALVDAEIRATSHGARSLDDLMRDLVAAGRRGEKITNASLVATVARFTGAPFAARIRAIVEDGATAELPATLHEPEPVARREQVHTFAYDLGFDRERTFALHRATGVRARTAAYGAGLREGQELAGWSIDGTDLDREVELSVREGGRVRTLRYLPHGAALTLFEYRLR